MKVFPKYTMLIIIALDVVHTTGKIRNQAQKLLVNNSEFQLSL